MHLVNMLDTYHVPDPILQTEDTSVDTITKFLLSGDLHFNLQSLHPNVSVYQ